MELDSEGKSAKTTGKSDTTSPLTEVQAWLEDWTDKREKLRELIRARAKEDPTYSWLTAEREVLLLDGVVQRIMSVTNTLNRPVK